jgi:hypothetical protein
MPTQETKAPPRQPTSLASMIIPALISGGTQLVGSAIRSRGAQRAAETQAEAAESASQRATQLYQDIYGQQRADIAPWRAAGEEALGDISRLTRPEGEMDLPFGREDFEADPGYQFRLEEGQKALERSAAARGGVLSGRSAKEAVRYGQGLGAQEYGAAFNRFQAERSSRFNRLANIAGIGQAATGLQAQATGQYGAMAGPSAERGILEAGVARAGGQAGTAGIWGQAAAGLGSNIANALMLRQIMNMDIGEERKLNEGEISTDKYSFGSERIPITKQVPDPVGGWANFLQQVVGEIGGEVPYDPKWFTGSDDLSGRLGGYPFNRRDEDHGQGLYNMIRF